MRTRYMYDLAAVLFGMITGTMLYLEFDEIIPIITASIVSIALSLINAEIDIRTKN